MKVFAVRWAVVSLTFACGPSLTLSQAPEKTEINPARVTVSMNADGSRTVYQFDDTQRKAIATTTGGNGKVRQTIRYELDDVGRFSSGRIFGPDGRLRLKSRYTYDNAGRLQEETQSAEDGTLLHKIVYSYDQNGKQTGYSIFDATGKLLGRTTPLVTSPSSSPKSRAKRSP